MKKFFQNKQDKKTDEKEDANIKKGFLKKVWYSIDKVEKYSELSAEGFGRAIKYFLTLVIILAIVLTAITIYETSIQIKSIAQYINENSPEFTYNDGILQVDSEDVIMDENSDFGKVIIDTKTESEEQINQYINELDHEENVTIILKDKLILKEAGIEETTEYNYNSLFEEIGITEFNKQQIVEYLTSSNILPLYLNLFLILFIYTFIVYLINILFYVITISIVGYLVTLILKLRIRYVAVFNMAIYAITLPTILNIIYIIINSIYGYVINYFNMMYVLVASIYTMAAIFILKSDFNKKQGEVQKIVEVEKEVKEEMKEKEKEKQEKEKEEKEKNKQTEKKDKKKKENSKKNKEDKLNGEEPEGSNA